VRMPFGVVRSPRHLSRLLQRARISPSTSCAHTALQSREDGAKPGVAMAAFAEPVVRIRLPPAASPCLTQTRPLQVENRGLRAGVRRSVGDAVGRDEQARQHHGNCR
jgi:hypothetical protein